MSRKDIKKFKSHLSRIKQQTGSKSEGIINSQIHNIQESIDQAYKAKYDKDKVDAIDSLFKYYAGGFIDIVNDYNLRKKDELFLKTFIRRYGFVIDSGLDEKYNLIRLRSHFVPDNDPSIPNKAILEIFPTENTLDNIIGLYESAIDDTRKNPDGTPIKPLISKPNNFKIVIQHYPHGFVGPNMGTRDVCLEIDL